MKVLLVVCNFSENTFNHAIAGVVNEHYKDLGHEVIYHDLYKENFNPVLTKEEYLEKDFTKIPDSYIVNCCNELREADIIVIVHPNWWGQPPALLKGWIDRVFRKGCAYNFSPQGEPIGLLKAENAYVIYTSNTPEDVEIQVYGDPLDNFWNTCVFKMCGVGNVHRFPIRQVIQSSEVQRKKWLAEVKDFLEN